MIPARHSRLLALAALGVALSLVALPALALAQDSPTTPAQAAAEAADAAAADALDAPTAAAAAPAPDQDIRGLKPAIVPAEPPLWPWLVGAGVAAAAGLGALGAWWWRRRRVPQLTPPEALELALAEALPLLEAGELRVYADRATAALKTYMATRSAVPADRMTTEELELALGEELPAQVREPLLSWLSRCDLLRFAHLDAELAPPEQGWLDGLLAALEPAPEPEPVPKELALSALAPVATSGDAPDERPPEDGGIAAK